MEIIRGFHNLQPQHRGCVATVGNYDGVHLGHQRVLTELKQRAMALGLPTVVVTFEPTPQEYLAPDSAPARLSRLREKIALLAEQGVDRLLVLRFAQSLAQTEPEDFILRLLVDGLGVRHLVVGDDFRFGRARRGDYAMLAKAGQDHRYTLESMATYLVNGARASSSRLRQALSTGDLVLTQQLLGRPYRLSGRVIRGQQLGRQLGYPTANIALHRLKSPLQGIFAVRVHGLSGGPHNGVASIGTRPTVDDDPNWLLEVHLFDADGDMYDQYLEVEFLHYLRNEERFDSLEALKIQMDLDADNARRYFVTARKP